MCKIVHIKVVSNTRKTGLKIYLETFGANKLLLCAQTLISLARTN